MQTRIVSDAEMNRRKYVAIWDEIVNLPDGSVLEVTGLASQAEAKRVRNALQGMAKYRGEIILTTSINRGDAGYVINIIKKERLV